MAEGGGVGRLGGARRLGASVLVLLVAGTLAVVTHDPPPRLATAVARATEIAIPAPVTAAVSAATTRPAPPETTTTAPPAVAPPTAPPTAPPPPPTAAPAPAPGPAPGSRTLPTAPPLRPAPVPAGAAPYRGLGTWVDVYDWSMTYSKGQPTVRPADAGRMAAVGAQTLYLQASKHDAPTDVLEPELLQDHIDRAGEAGLRVVVWYLPTLVDPERDLRRLVAVAGLRNVDGVAVDIEARDVADVAERNRRLVELSAALRRALPGRTLGAILLPPVTLEVINPGYWPAFPYRDIAPYYDVWMTMSYWTNRTSASGYRDAYRYTKENVDRLRNNLGQPGALVHPIGGIAHRTTGPDVEGYKQAAFETSSIGGSLYDWHTTGEGLWGHLRGLRG